MRKSLLAHIAGDFISQYENVANSSVCYLLNEYPAARDALKAVLDIDSVPDASRYKTEESTQSHGRPDVTGTDVHGKKTVIIEGKFWANLTENQPNGYLKELVSGGHLLFLVPDRRIKSIKLELEKRIEDGKDKVLIVHSWNNFLKLVERENNKNHDDNLDSDLIQLKALCERMDVEGMPPLSMFDLDPMNGRISAQLVDVINECKDIIRELDYTNFSGLRTTSTQYGHGFYFYAHNFGCHLYFSSYKWFTRDNHTPIWVSIKNRKFEIHDKINHALNSFDQANSYDEKLGIILKPGMDKGQVVQHIVNRVKGALQYVNDNVAK